MPKERQEPAEGREDSDRPINGLIWCQWNPLSQADSSLRSPDLLTGVSMNQSTDPQTAQCPLPSRVMVQEGEDFHHERASGLDLEGEGSSLTGPDAATLCSSMPGQEVLNEAVLH